MISKLLKKNEKGFTLMEMLIVVAIIAVLVAIAIPTFTSSLNKARVATDEANIRSGYASVMLDILNNDITTDKTYQLNKDGSVSETTAANAYKTLGKGTATEIAGISVAAWETDKTVTYTYHYNATTAAGSTPAYKAGEITIGIG